MEKITFLKQEDGSYLYIGKIVWREDTFETVKDKIIEREISEEDLEKIDVYKCSCFFDGENITLEESTQYKERYKFLRQGEYPDFLDFIDAQVKKTSSDPEMVKKGEMQEIEYINKCLEVKEKYPKPIF